jgi:hypothetical protein
MDGGLASQISEYVNLSTYHIARLQNDANRGNFHFGSGRVGGRRFVHRSKNIEPRFTISGVTLGERLHEGCMLRTDQVDLAGAVRLGNELVCDTKLQWILRIFRPYPDGSVRGIPRGHKIRVRREKSPQKMIFFKR